MPTGFTDTLSPVARLIEWMQPQRILDIGVGNGRMGVIAREYAAAPWSNRFCEGIRIVDGIEGHRSYLGPLHEAVYDEVVVGEAIATLRDFDSNARRYDLGLAIDILEHFDALSAREFIDVCRRVCNVLAVATPRWYFEQRSAENPLEEHRSFWPAAELLAAGAVEVREFERSSVALFGDRQLIRDFQNENRPLSLVVRLRSKAKVRTRVRSLARLVQS